MTNDNHFFRKLVGKKPAAGQMPLYEGKMIHQFDADYSPGNAAIPFRQVMLPETDRITPMVNNPPNQNYRLMQP